MPKAEVSDVSMTGLTNRHTFERGFHLTFVVACRLAD
jgi:hypothetical protein